MVSSSLLSLLVMATFIELNGSANILMVTMGGTKSHKIPFWALAKGLTTRGHNITFISAFPSDFGIVGMEEITPTGLVFYVRNFTDWDLLGARMRGEEPVHPLDMLRYGYEACEALLSDSETQEFLYSKQKFDLIILDGAYPECALGFVHFFKAPFMYINTVGFYTGSLSIAGNPTPYSVTPFLARPFTDSMNLLQRTSNAVWHLAAQAMHMYMVKYNLQKTLRRYFGSEVPPIYDMARNVSFILQNAYATVTYPRPYLPNVAEIACIHCKPSKPLPKDLEKFVSGSGDAGFIYVSMGSSVRTANMPEYLRRMLLRVFRELPQRVLWKWESDDNMPDLPANVKLRRWLPQQDLLGHKKIRAFITHGGLLSMFETVYHGVPIVSLPVFCDHDSNAAKAEVDGYALKLDFSSLTAEKLLGAINKVIYDPKYKDEVKRRQMLLRDQKETPLERSIFWTEYVLRHRGAKHLQSPARNLSVIEYYMIDVICLLVLSAILMWYLMKIAAKIMYRIVVTGSCGHRMYDKVIKIE
ncbi:2-hydroxyacylsphingosine 1-beta-galactosyltransferase [Agrilus planipennis]|uniref:UDP-glucuronosyltransferase n=1 Tax=Agrilus planipennis TaxID=224129 RepID=A0A1W4WHH1_AGRPL|nr:2-hydroxyacylsphingosine 1-beta-galactosyltransferase [Agrilus planipennis]